MSSFEAESVVRPSRRRSVLAVAFGMLGILLLCALGTWQVERLHWKQGVIQQIDERTHAAPKSVAEIEDIHRRTGDVEYYPVALRGRFLNDSERYFLSTYGGEAGWNVYVPLNLGDNRFVFVNRGFVPYDLKDPAKRAAGVIDGAVEVTGLARNAYAAKPSWILPNNDLKKNQFFWKNIPEMVQGARLPQAAEVLPFVVDAGPGRAPGGWPVGGTTIIDIPNNHLQYAVTWYGMALVLAVMLTLPILRAYRARRSGEERG